MTLARLPGALSLPFPATFQGVRNTPTGTTGGFSALTGGPVIDATGEKAAFVGHVVWAGGATSKTMDSTSKIYFRLGVTTMADVGTTVRIGLQDIDAASGPVIRPDGTFDVYRDIAGNDGTITSADDNVGKSITLSTSGSKTVTNGQFLAVVFDMTARAGSDSLAFLGGVTTAGHAHAPVCLQYTTSWQGATGGWVIPNFLLESSDGTLGTFYGCAYFGPGSAYSYASSGTPDERALVFQVPFRCKINAVQASIGFNNTATTDAEMILYSDPLGTPVAVETVTLLGEQAVSATDERINFYMFTSERILEPNTNYAIAFKATSTGSFQLGYVTLSDAAHREINGMANCQGGSRTDGSGAFGSLSTTDIPVIAVGICALDDGNGSGRAQMLIGGMQ